MWNNDIRSTNDKYEGYNEALEDVVAFLKGTEK